MAQKHRIEMDQERAPKIGSCRSLSFASEIRTGSRPVAPSGKLAHNEAQHADSDKSGIPAPCI